MKYYVNHHIRSEIVDSFSSMLKMAYLTKAFLVTFIWIFVPNIFIRSTNSGRQMEIIVSNRGKCPEEEKNPARLNGNFTRVGLNKYSINGTLEVDRVIAANLSVCEILPTFFANAINQLLFSIKKKIQVIYKRCNSAGTQCDDYGKIPIGNICGIIEQRNSFWSNFLDHTHPRINCPIKKVIFFIKNLWRTGILNNIKFISGNYSDQKCNNRPVVNFKSHIFIFRLDNIFADL